MLTYYYNHKNVTNPIETSTSTTTTTTSTDQARLSSWLNQQLQCLNNETKHSQNINTTAAQQKSFTSREDYSTSDDTIMSFNITRAPLIQNYTIYAKYQRN